MKPRTLSVFRRSSRLMRLATASVLAGQVMTAVPVLAQDAARAGVRATSRAAATVQHKAAKAAVRVNRTLPTVTPPNIDPMFGLNVTTEVLRTARVFPEQLIPTAEPSAEQNAALARTLEQLAVAPAERRGAIVDAHIRDYPTTPWRASLLANAGTLYAREGYFSRAAAYWAQAWEMTRDSGTRDVRTLAEYALGESVGQMVKFGQVARLEARLNEAEGRDVRGAAGGKVADGWEGLRMLRGKHETALFSGPEALKMYLTVRPIPNGEFAMQTITAYHPTAEGTSMTELRDLGKRAGVSLELWKASSVDEFPVPSIVHLRSEHFSAIVEKKDGRYRLRDPGLGGDIWIRGDALKAESTGFVLSAQRPEGLEWRPATDSEGAALVGHCTPGKPGGDDPMFDQPTCGGPGPGAPPPTNSSGEPPPTDDPCPGGMPYYRFHPTSASLVIDDAPLGYRPPIGPGVALRLSYNHRSYKTPSTFGYGHVGPLWTFNALSYVTDNTSMVLPPYEVTEVYLRGHGRELYTSYDPVHPISKATLVKVANDPPRYERRLPSGAIDIFELADRAASLAGRRIFLTQSIDGQGHAIAYTYDSSFRLVAITDAIGQVTTFSYESTSDTNLLTTVTDPFGRFATLGYDSAGRLTSITDVAGMTSTFAYGSSDFIAAMTTPYGTTTFRHEPSATTGATFRLIEATDPVGGRERLEFHLQNAQFAATAPSGEVPTGFSASNAALDYYNSFYWDKLAMARHPGDYSQAINYNWMLEMDVSYGHAMSRPVPHSIKAPLEHRVWFRYPGQAATDNHTLRASGRRPALIGRVLDGGASQVTQVSYNAQGRVTSVIDPAGRERTATYATNGLDLLEVRQVVSGGTDLLQSYADYTSRRVPETVTDAAGEETNLAYNSLGQPLTVTNALSQASTFTYDSTSQQLLTVTGAVSGATTTYTYDAYGRVETVTSADGYMATRAYDALDRVTQVTYPDDTTETMTYARLDLVEQKDRLGRVTRHLYDGFGRRIATRDPAGRTVSLVWCACGTLDALVDANGNRTRWERDVQGRVTREVRADETTDTLYTYDVTGQLKTVTDPKDQITTYSYNIDGSLAQVAFTNANIATPTISYTYDAYYPRMLTMVDGVGTTTYAYRAAGTTGALGIASVDGPFSSDTITYGYDELGRVTSRLLNSTGTALTYDTLGRISQLSFPIGDFDYTYVNQTSRVSSVTYPNDQTMTYSYFDDEHDFRLQTIHHKNPSAATLSKFDYTYDVVGNILTWRQERAGATTQQYTFGHDLVDQLTSAVLTDTNTTPNILARQAWSYDPAGNRTVVQNDDAVFATSHDSLNRLQSRAPGGPIVMSGTVNEAATVTIDGKPVTVDASNNFNGTAQIGSGTTTVTVKAKDPTGNETTQQYEIDAAGSTTSYTYDANGNLTADGTKTYFWNALNQLVEVKAGSTTLATFEYDGEGRRTEKVAAGLTRQYIYDAEDIVEERISGSTTDTLRYYHGAGIDEPLARKNSSDVVTYYLADHLGSIVQETNASGAVILEREYGPWGDLLSGASTAGYAFQGREWDSEIALFYFRARYYNAAAGAWASDDPIGFGGGSNFTQFVSNNPLRFVDPFGLCRNEEDEPEQQLEFKPGTTEEEKRLIREAIDGTTESLEMMLLAGSLVETGGLAAFRDPKKAAKLLKTAKKLYPNKFGKTELHHLLSKYLGGDPKGPTVPLDASYHQMITNAFRKLWPYGSGTPTMEQATQIMKEVYSKLPLP